jgi:hypothetical protein
METTIAYAVQIWSERYEYWHTTAEPVESMFDFPVTSYETEKAARARLAELHAACATVTYRLVRVTTTVEVI